MSYNWGPHFIVPSETLKKFSDKKIQGIDWLMHKGKIKEEICQLIKVWVQTHTDDTGNSLFKS